MKVMSVKIANEQSIDLDQAQIKVSELICDTLKDEFRYQTVSFKNLDRFKRFITEDKGLDKDEGYRKIALDVVSLIEEL